MNDIIYLCTNQSPLHYAFCYNIDVDQKLNIDNIGGTLFPDHVKCRYKNV